MSSDAYHITAGEPEGAGAARAMEEAAEGSDWGSVLFVPAGSDLMNKLLGA